MRACWLHMGFELWHGWLYSTTQQTTVIREEIRKTETTQKRQKSERLAEIREAENSSKKTALMDFSIFAVQTL